jgi:hypothetical protein
VTETDPVMERLRIAERELYAITGPSPELRTERDAAVRDVRVWVAARTAELVTAVDSEKRHRPGRRVLTPEECGHTAANGYAGWHDPGAPTSPFLSEGPAPADVRAWENRLRLAQEAVSSHTTSWAHAERSVESVANPFEWLLPAGYSLPYGFVSSAGGKVWARLAGWSDEEIASFAKD